MELNAIATSNVAALNSCILATPAPSRPSHMREGEANMGSPQLTRRASRVCWTVQRLCRGASSSLSSVCVTDILFETAEFVAARQEVGSRLLLSKEWRCVSRRCVAARAVGQKSCPALNVSDHSPHNYQEL